MYLVKTAAQPGVGTQLVQRVDGLGCCRDGLGLFDGGLDFSTWGVGEWAAVGVGAFALYSMFSTSKRGYRAAREGVKSTRRALKRNPSGLRKAWNRYTREGLTPRVKSRMLASERRSGKRKAAGKRDYYRDGR